MQNNPSENNLDPKDEEKDQPEEEKIEEEIENRIEENADVSDSESLDEEFIDEEEGSEGYDEEKQIKDELLAFSELEELTDQDFADMEDAIAENLTEETELEEIASEPSAMDLDQENSESVDQDDIPAFAPEIDDDLEAKMQAEIQKKKKEMGVKTVTKEKFVAYLSTRRNKIVYHALWHLVFNVEDHTASKQALYEALKEVTSKNPVEPLEEHKFYFGLGFILRQKLYDEKLIQFKDGKLKLMSNPDHLKEILMMVGDPISDRPILTKTEKKHMFEDFLNDEFLDI